MPINDIEVHEKVRHDKRPAGCNNKPRSRKSYRIPVRLYDEQGVFYAFGTEEIEHGMSVLCRQVGQYINSKWEELDECEGCNPIWRDHEYISKMRSLHEQEMQSLKLHI